MKPKTHIAMAKTNDPKGLIMAAQAAFIEMLRDILAGVKRDAGEKVPGLTWEQIDYFLVQAGKKEPKIFEQEEPM